MRRVRPGDDGTETVFELLSYDQNGPYRAEISVATLDELRALKREGKLIALRMIGTPTGKVPQRSLIPWREIEGFDWDV